MIEATLHWFSAFARAAVPELVDVTLKGAVILLLSWALVGVLRGSRLRHLVWLSGLTSLLVFPWLPDVGLKAPLLDPPQPAASTEIVEPLELPRYESDRPHARAALEGSSAPEPRRVVRKAAARTVVENVWPQGILLVWLLGVGSLGFRYAFRRIELARLRRTATLVDDEDWHVSLSEAKRALGLRRAAVVLMSARTPVSFAWRRYVVVPETAKHWSKDQRELVLLHELVHIRRRDHLGIVLTEVACMFHWMNPLVWLAATRIDGERERAADDAVLATGARPSAYARVLLEIASRLAEPALTGPAITGRTTIETRLHSILDPQRTPETSTPRRRFAILSSFALLSLAMASMPILATSQPPSTSTSSAGSATEVIRVVGTVRDERGRPIVDATIRFGAGNDYTVTRSDRSGQFEVETKMPDPGQLYVNAPGFAPWSTHRIDPNTNLEVLLERGTRVEGVVRDARTHDPVMDARVRTTGLAGTDPLRSLDSDLGIVETHTDENGRFRLEDLAPGARTVWAVAPGYDRVEVDVAAHARGESLEILLRTGSAILGMVLAADGAPVSGATVRPVPRLDTSPAHRMETVKTNEGGRFELLGLDPGSYTLVIAAPEHPSAVVRDIDLPEVTTLTVDVRLSKGATLTGRMVDEQGDGLAGTVSIPLLQGDELIWFRGAEAPSVEVAADGHFELVRVPAGSLELLVEPRGFQGRRLSIEVAGDSTRTDLGEVRFLTGRTIEGYVLDEVGEPVVGANVYAFAERPFIVNVVEGPAPVPRTVSGEDGSFRIAGLEPGDYRINASSVRGQASSEELIVEAGTMDVELVLHRAGAVKGRVVDVDGRPIPSFSVRLEEERRSGGRRMTTALEQQFHEADGTFAIPGLSATSYAATVSAIGLKPTSITRLDIPGPVTVDLGDVVLRRGASIRGRVIDPDGEAVPGAMLSTYPEAPGGTTVTDADGRFEILGFHDGVVDVRASHPHYAQALLKDVEVRVERGPVEVELRLSHGGRLEGLVRGRDGGGVADRLIRIQSIQTRDRGQVRTGNDGAFVFDRLPVGRHRVELLSGDERLRVPLQEREVRVEEGQTASVEFESSVVQVSGYVLRSGVPLGGAQIALRPAGARGGFSSSGGGSTDSLPLLALTKPDGFYELWVDHPGPYTAEASLSGTGASLPSKDVMIPDVSSHRLDLAFDSVAVSGRVISAETAEPVVAAEIRIYPVTDDAMTRIATSARADGTGAFHLELGPGAYRIRVAADDYAPREEGLIVDADTPLPEITIELSAGRRIVGKVVDAESQPPGLFYVHALEDVGSPMEPPRSSQWAEIHPDGTFELRDLADARYNLLAGSDILGFAFAPGLRPGARPLLHLSPAGWVDVVVRSSEGTAVAGTPVALIAINGEKTRGVLGQTDDHGKVSLYVPTGDLMFKAVRRDGLQGVARVAVGETSRASVEIHIQDPSPTR